MFKTYPEFWNIKLSKKIQQKEKKKFDLIFSANTISHIPNLEETFKGIKISLSENGILVIEDPSLLSVLINNSYDQFYDEHVYVFSLISMKNIASQYDLRLFDADKISTHGGSIRYYICKKNAKFQETKNLKKLIRKEINSKLNNFSTYKKFSQRVFKSKKRLKNLLHNLKKRIKQL